MPEPLPRDIWTARRAEHEQRVRQWTEPHARRRAEKVKHPVLDFLFTYYSHRPSRLSRWHPGFGVTLADAPEFLRFPGYVRVGGGVTVGEIGENRIRTAEFVHSLLTATSGRQPRLGCFGLHEWAMLYRGDGKRHEEWPLRLGSAGTDAVVENSSVACSHFDAFRFFTPEARPLNTLTPTRKRQAEFEQPGCLHASMDLYKWAYKLDTLVSSELVADCFQLAVSARELDMRASPYDLTDLGYSPVPIETPAGRAEYVRGQSALAERAAPLRARLIDVCAGLLTVKKR